ncbi:MAG TPA: DUF6608 family protein [Candidatus Limnocylindria bacterium]|nr:DUF6608 family protein [Candidatus Limnocylindria bacterium]
MANERRTPRDARRRGAVRAASRYCAIFTVATLASSGLQLALGQPQDDNFHILNRAVVILIAVAAIELAVHVRIESRVGHWFAVYVPTMLLVFGYVWLTGFVEPLARHAYRDVFLNYTVAAVLVGVVLNAADLVRDKLAERSRTASA